MPNVVSAPDQIFYNVTQLGTAGGTGTTSSLLITPNPGYFINSSMFSVVADALQTDYVVSFEDTTSAADLGNNVLAIVTWNTTATIDENYIVVLNISLDNISNTFSSTASNLTLSVVEPVDSVVTLTTTESPGSFNVSLSQFSATSQTATAQVFGSIQQEIVDICLELSEGTYYFSDEYQQFFNIPSDSISIELVNEYLDNYGKCYKKKFRVYFTPTGQDEEIIITTGSIQTVQYFANFEEPLHLFDENAVNEAILLLNHNIPAAVFDTTPAASWINDGETTGDQAVVRVDIEALPDASPREQVLSLREMSYPNITRHTTIVKQAFGPAVNLRVITIPPGEYVGNDAPVLQTIADSGKVVSNPNANENEFAVNQGGTQNIYNNNFYSETKYKLKLIVDPTVTLENVNSNLFELIQEEYPTGGVPSGLTNTNNGSFVDTSSFTWQGVGDQPFSQYEREFYIRNQDKVDFQGTSVTSSDRAATFKFTHPNDSSVSDTLQISQDASYNSSNDTVNTVIDAGTFSAAFTKTVQPYQTALNSAGNNFGQQAYVLFIRMADWENDFNLQNHTTTDETEVDTFKQYPRPRIELNTSSIIYLHGGGQIVGDTTWYSQVDTTNLVYNTSYDASDATQNYQYSLTFTVSNNDTFSDRTLSFYVYHSQNLNNFNTANQDAISNLKQLAGIGVDAYPYPYDNEVNGVFTNEIDFGTQAEDQTVRYDYNGSDPTIGLWDNTNNTYTPLAAGTTIDGFSYSSPIAINTNIGGANTKQTVVSYTANTPAGVRTQTLAWWHSSLNPLVDAPNDFIKFSQAAPPANVDLHYVNCVNNGNQIQSSSSGTVTFNLTVSDYTQNDFNLGINEPIISLVRVSTGVYPGSIIITDTENLIPTTASLTILANPSFILGQHTHTVSVAYNENTSTNQLFFALRSRHQFFNVYDDNNTVFVWVQPAEQMIFPTSYVTFSDQKQVTVPSDAQSVSLEVKTNLGATIDDRLYRQEKDYIVARFLSDNNTKVWKNPSSSEYSGQDSHQLPITFFTDGAYGNIYTSEQVIKSTTKTESDANADGQGGTPILSVETEVLQSGAFPSVNYFFAVPVGQNNTGADLVSHIGIWTGKKAPKTNLIDYSFPLSNSGTQATASSSFATDLGTGSLNAASNLIRNHIIDIDSTNETIKWNQGAAFDFNGITTGFTSSGGYGLLKLHIQDPSDVFVNTSTIYGKNKVLGISFTVEDFEFFEGTAFDDYLGIATGGWGVPNYNNNAASPSFTELLAGLRINSDGECSGKIKMSATVSFINLFFRSSCKATVKNLKVWEIDDDRAIKPGLGLTFDTAPNDTVKIIQKPFLADQVVFDQSGFNGSATTVYHAELAADFGGGNAVVSANSEQITYSGGFNGQIKIDLDNEEFASTPVIKIWDGSSSSDISSSWTWVNNFNVIEGGNPEAAAGSNGFSGTLSYNFTGSTRTVVLGLYNGNPASTSTSPIDTLTINQTSVENPL